LHFRVPVASLVSQSGKKAHPPNFSLIGHASVWLLRGF
jgi:hypothetical protein